LSFLFFSLFSIGSFLVKQNQKEGAYKPPLDYYGTLQIAWPNSEAMPG
jgi:hypothetical protein